jgi:hypothetical protein
MVNNIMESKSSAQMVARGQIHAFNASLQPLENGIAAMYSAGTLDPIG